MSLVPADSKHGHLPGRGDTIDGKYVLEDVLGAGGMGLVVAARHLALGTRVALKFLAGVSISDELRLRFQREAQAAASIRNEHVARVLDTGFLPDRTPYMVMDLLEGRDLGVELKGRLSLPLEEAADYLVQACDGLAEAHARGIVHRDIKPSNLFLCRSPSGHVVLKVLDFGISKAEGAAHGDTTLTDTSTILGSPSYMSPEQIRHAKGVDGRTDVWALGVVLHQLLTGELPFRGSGTSSTLASVMVDEPPSVRAQRSEIPQAIDDILARCLQKNAAFRFQTVRELAVALAPHASDRARALTARMIDGKPDLDRTIVDPIEAVLPSRTYAESATDTQAASILDEKTKPERTRARTILSLSLGAFALVAMGTWLARGSFRAIPESTTTTAPSTDAHPPSATSATSASDKSSEANDAMIGAPAAITSTSTLASNDAAPAKGVIKTKTNTKSKSPAALPAKTTAPKTIATMAPTTSSTLKSVLDGHK